MADLRDTDLFLVNRGGASYTTEFDNIRDNVNDDDLMLVNRNGVSYTTTGEEFKDALGPAGTVDKPSIIAPADNAGELLTVETDEITGSTRTTLSLSNKWTSVGVNHPADSEGPFNEDFGYVYRGSGITTGMTWDATSQPEDPQAISGNGKLQIAWTTHS